MPGTVLSQHHTHGPSGRKRVRAAAHPKDLLDFALGAWVTGNWETKVARGGVLAQLRDGGGRPQAPLCNGPGACAGGGAGGSLGHGNPLGVIFVLRGWRGARGGN